MSTPTVLAYVRSPHNLLNALEWLDQNGISPQDAHIVCEWSQKKSRDGLIARCREENLHLAGFVYRRTVASQTGPALFRRIRRVWQRKLTQLHLRRLSRTYGQVPNLNVIMGIIHPSSHIPFLLSLQGLKKLTMVDEGLGQQRFIEMLDAASQKDSGQWRQLANTVEVECFSYLPLRGLDRVDASLVTNTFRVLKSNIRRSQVEKGTAIIIGPCGLDQDSQEEILKRIKSTLANRGVADITYNTHRCEMQPERRTRIRDTCISLGINLSCWSDGFEQWLTTEGSLPEYFVSCGSTVSAVLANLHFDSKNIVFKLRQSDDIYVNNYDSLQGLANRGSGIEFVEM